MCRGRFEQRHRARLGRRSLTKSKEPTAPAGTITNHHPHTAVTACLRGVLNVEKGRLSGGVVARAPGLSPDRLLPRTALVSLCGGLEPAARSSCSRCCASSARACLLLLPGMLHRPLLGFLPQAEHPLVE